MANTRNVGHSVEKLERTNDEYISTHKITEMLRYILITEGWQSYYSNDTYKIDITRNGNICSI